MEELCAIIECFHVFLLLILGRYHLITCLPNCRIIKLILVWIRLSWIFAGLSGVKKDDLRSFYGLLQKDRFMQKLEGN